MQNFNESDIKLTNEKFLPHNFLAEKFILSSLLIRSEPIEISLRTIKPETFYFKNQLDTKGLRLRF